MQLRQNHDPPTHSSYTPSALAPCPASRLSMVSQHMEWAPKARPCPRDRSRYHCQATHLSSTCRGTSSVLSGLLNCQSRVPELPGDQVKCLCGLPSKDKNLISDIFESSLEFLLLSLLFILSFTLGSIVYRFSIDVYIPLPHCIIHLPLI